MKLMLIDDELPILESLKQGIKPMGYTCVAFQNPLIALEAYPQGGFDVVVTDFMMPEMNGIDVLKAIKSLHSEARVIILTGYADIENAIAAVNNGAYAFFRKPLNFREFIQTLKKTEEECAGDRRTEVDMQRFMEEYSRLRTAFESLHGVVQQMTSMGQEGER
jgi:DNA-binding NtrC family response regulator